MTEDIKWKFIENEIWILTFSGALRRSKTYKRKNISDKDKSKFRNAIKEYVRTLIEKYYLKGISEKQHLKNIEELCDWASREYESILNDGRLKIGVGQKLLNLYLKYLWSLNKIPLPPHCPIDRIIISEIDKKFTKNWTELDDIDEYKNLIEKAKEKANSKSIAEWELESYSRRVGGL